MPSSSGISVRGERVGTLDWSDSGYTDDALATRIDEVLPKLFERLKTDANNAECSVNLAGNRLRGSGPLDVLLKRLREAKVQVITLRLHKNQLTDEAMNALVEHLKLSAKDNRPLLELHLSDNKITEVGVRKLIEAAHQCKFYFSANSTPERRCRALWLRVENQRPALSDPHKLLEELNKEGLTVCLLPSKEFQLPAGGKGRNAQMDAPVHMHQAFAPRSERHSSDSWVAKDHPKGGGKDKDGSGKDHGKDHGKDRDRDHGKDHHGKDHGGKGDHGKRDHGGKDDGGKDHGGKDHGGKDHGGKDHGGKDHGGKDHGGKDHGKSGKDDWWEDKGKGKDSSGRNGKDGGDRLPSKQRYEENPPVEKTGKGKGNSSKGASAAESNSSSSKQKSFANYEDHKGKGKAIAESWRNADNYSSKKTRDEKQSWSDWCDNDWEPGNNGHSRPSRSGRDGGGRGDQSDARQDGGRQGDRDGGGGGGASGSGAWGSARPSQPSGGQGQQSQQSQGGYPAGQGGAYGGQQQSQRDQAGNAWLNNAAESVRWKVKVCKNLGLLPRSLQPSQGAEAEWQAVANLGARTIAQQCWQRASVMVGSFVDESGIHELSGSCAGERGLASVFRQLSLGGLFAPGTLKDETNDSQCASLLAALFGELVDWPLTGESTHKENARKVAEWALLDFIFLMGTTQLASAGFPGLNARSGPDYPAMQ